MIKIIKIAVRTLLAAVCLILCAYNIYNLVARYAFGTYMPTVFGYAGAAVVSGSMDDDDGDDIEVGDFVIVHSQSDYEIGDVIMFSTQNKGEYVTHRIVAITQSGYETKGDANNASDLEKVDNSDVVGKVVSVIKGAGNALQFLRSPLGLLSIIGAGVVIWVITDVISALTERKKDESKD